MRFQEETHCSSLADVDFATEWEVDSLFSTILDFADLAEGAIAPSIERFGRYNTPSLSTFRFNGDRTHHAHHSSNS
ncbi:MAG: hypothetical protein AB4426_32635 [Xenococcaceae cyanobacterium]